MKMCARIIIMSGISSKMSSNSAKSVCVNHGPACIAFHCSHLHIYITNPGSVCHFAKTWVSLQTTTYINKNTKYFGINLLLT